MNRLATLASLPAAAIALTAIAAPASACQCMCANDIPDCVDSGETLWDCIGDFIAYGCGGSSDCCWSVGSPVLTFDQQDDSGKPICYLKYKLENAYIKSWSVAGSANGDPIPTEDLAINFTKIEYTPMVVGYDAAGSPIIETVKETAPVPFDYDPETGKGFVKLEFPADADMSTPKLLEVTLGGTVYPKTKQTFVLIPACEADLNLDGVMDAADLNIILAAFGETDEGDIDGDGDTDAVDLNRLLAVFGNTCY